MVRVRSRLVFVLGLLAALALTPAGPEAGATTPRITKGLTIVGGNHGTASTLRGMPYLASLASRYGRTTGYRSLTHPSLPNYLAMVSGSTFGVRDDRSPASHHLPGSSVFDAAVSRGRAARTYAESMPSSCRTSAASPYAVKHNPWAYFSGSNQRRYCSRYDVPAGTSTYGPLHRDVVYGHLPNVGLLVPNLCHDAHDCSLATADSWLRTWMRVIMAGPDYRAGHLAVVITFDEVEGTGTG